MRQAAGIKLGEDGPLDHVFDLLNVEVAAAAGRDPFAPGGDEFAVCHKLAEAPAVVAVEDVCGERDGDFVVGFDDVLHRVGQRVLCDVVGFALGQVLA